MKFYARQRRMPTVIIVSLIDIFSILLIFVLVTTAFRRDQPEVAIKLPASKSATAAPADIAPVIVGLTPKGQILFDEKPVDIAGLSVAVRQVVKASPERPIALRADEKAPFGIVINVLDTLKEAGVTSNVSAFTESAK